MRALCTTLLALFVFVVPVRAHVGSPNVFFEGKAGTHSVRVMIRPPPTLPGMAQVDVRVEGATEVWLQAAPWSAGDEAAPPPVRAEPVAGATGLFHAPLWLLGRGSYRVRVSIESPGGGGSLSVPLNSAATQRPVMPPALGGILIALAVALGVGAIALARAAAREATLEPGALPTAGDQRRARSAGLVMAFLLVVSVAGGAWRWQIMDREFRNNALAKPRPMEASIREAGTLRLLRLTPGRDRSPTVGWDTLVTDHGKLMHLFLCREPDFTVFAHLHPVRRDAETFENVLPPLPAGTYQLYAEITDETGLSETLTARLELPPPAGPELPPMADWKAVNDVWCRAPTVPLENAAQPFALDADDAWLIGPAPVFSDTRAQVSALPEGSKMVFENAGELMVNRDTALRFTVFTAEGGKVAFQPYMGMLGHSVVRRADGSVFAHLHPAGTVSMAAEELLAQRDRPEGVAAAMPPVTGDTVTFPYAFPQGGDYRVWTQVRIGGQVVTGDFAVRVK
jgi:hypothetical protein